MRFENEANSVNRFNGNPLVLGPVFLHTEGGWRRSNATSRLVQTGGSLRSTPATHVVKQSLILATLFLSGCGVGITATQVAGSGSKGSGTATATPSQKTSETALSGELVLTGSSTIAPLAVEMAKRFEKRHPNVRIDVQTGGSSRGIADVRSGTADIGMASRDLKPGEEGFRKHRIAVDGICLIVHAENPVRSLTSEQTVAIFRGEIDHWIEVGGNDQPIVVVHKAEGRATLEVFLKHFELENSHVRPDVIVGDNQQGIKTVAGNPLAIGYVSIGAANVDRLAGTPIRLLELDGIAPTDENVANGTFPITRPLHFVTRGEPTGLAQAFLDFALGPAVHDLVKAQYFVTLSR